jgi:hypothetical protein
VLTLKVAGYGGDGDLNQHPGSGGWGATGYGGRGGSGTYGDGGGGGGATSIQLGSDTVIVAGGGGGAGGRGPSDVDSGGPGGSSGTTADPGHDGKGPGAGKGGRAGASGTGSGGSGGKGAHLGGGGGGGGAGQLGGDGGGGGGFGAGGGGGGGAGTSFRSAAVQFTSVVRGGTSDGNGLIFITWLEASAPVCHDQSVFVPASSPGVPFRLQCTDFSHPTSFRVVTLPDHGLLDDRDLYAGTFTYVPLPGYTGTDSMVFQALHGDLASAPATVTFNIQSIRRRR